MATITPEIWRTPTIDLRGLGSAASQFSDQLLRQQQQQDLLAQRQAEAAAQQDYQTKMLDLRGRGVSLQEQEARQKQLENEMRARQALGEDVTAQVQTAPGKAPVLFDREDVIARQEADIPFSTIGEYQESLEALSSKPNLTPQEQTELVRNATVLNSLMQNPQAVAEWDKERNYRTQLQKSQALLPETGTVVQKGQAPQYETITKRVTGSEYLRNKLNDPKTSARGRAAIGAILPEMGKKEQSTFGKTYKDLQSIDPSLAEAYAKKTAFGKNTGTKPKDKYFDYLANKDIQAKVDEYTSTFFGTQKGNQEAKAKMNNTLITLFTLGDMSEKEASVFVDSIGTTDWIGRGQLEPELAQKFFGNQTIVNAQGQVLPLGDSIATIMNDPDNYSVTRLPNGRVQLVSTKQGAGAELQRRAQSNPLLP